MLKRLSHKLNLSPKHIAHTLTEDVGRTSKEKSQKDCQNTTKSSQCPKGLKLLAAKINSEILRLKI